MKLKNPNKDWIRPALDALRVGFVPSLLEKKYKDTLCVGVASEGHCYVAAEVIWHALGGKESRYVPQVMRVEGGTHWFLKNSLSGEIVDPTWDQFFETPLYNNAHGSGFLTKAPSKRAVEMMRLSGLSASCLKDLIMLSNVILEKQKEVLSENRRMV